jgi:hypothetical protein
MQAHNPKVVSSNLAPATHKKVRSLETSPFCVSAMASAWAQGKEGHVMGGGPSSGQARDKLGPRASRRGLEPQG